MDELLKKVRDYAVRIDDAAQGMQLEPTAWRMERLWLLGQDLNAIIEAAQAVPIAEPQEPQGTGGVSSE